MATTKVKGTSKKIKELKGVKPEKITDEQLNKVQSMINGLHGAQSEIGVLETKKHQILHQIAGINDQLAMLQNEFQKEYGTTDINIKDGVINYEKENGEVNKKD